MSKENKVFVPVKKIYTGGTGKGYPRPVKLPVHRTIFLDAEQESKIFKGIEESKKKAAARKKTAARKKADD